MTDKPDDSLDVIIFGMDINPITRESLRNSAVKQEKLSTLRGINQYYGGIEHEQGTSDSINEKRTRATYNLAHVQGYTR